MKRRTLRGIAEPPARLRSFDPADWLPLVDPADYDPEWYRNHREGEPYGEPVLSFEDWRESQAGRLWSQARQAWYDEHGWPNELTGVDLLRDDLRARRRLMGRGDPR